MHHNLLLLTDSYKCTHWKQYPPKTEKVYSYLEARPKNDNNFSKTLFFGLQYYLDQYLSGWRVGISHIYEADLFWTKHLGDKNLFNREGWEYIHNVHDGFLPVSIKAVPEGTLVPRGNVLMTIENTDPKCFWLTNYLETLLVQTWYGTTVATQSYEMRQIILNYLHKTGDPSLIDFKLHDFGFRGVSSVETAGIGACAHLINFKGTDTTAGLLLAQNHYNCDMAGHSIPAAEHSTIISWGRDHESEAYENMLTQFPGMVAVVSDSYDLGHACKEIWGKQLKDKVLAHEGTLVVRPDSGIPWESVVNTLNALGDAFGYERNAKDYKVLNPKVRVIQGDGINLDSMRDVLDAMENSGWSADNIAFGSGGALLQKVDRDTCSFAFKCAEVVVDGVSRGVSKCPVGDVTKKSKSGRMKLIYNGEFKTVSENEPGEDCLVEVFRNGLTFNRTTFDEIRQRASS